MKRVKKGVKKDNTIVLNYKKSWEFIKESKNFIWAVVILFFVAVFVGFLFQPSAVVDLINEYIKEILERTDGMSTLDLTSFILLNNLKIAFMGILYGVALGILPILSTLANGYVVGYVSSTAVSSSGLSSLLNLLPHGIFELPAIFLSFGLGIKFGSFVFHKDKMNKFKEFFVNSLRVFFLVVLPLLVIAAIIEGTLISFLK